MSRRRKVVLSSAITLMAIALLIVVFFLAGTQTQFGQERVRSFVSSWLSAKVRGRMYVGRISGGLLSGVVIDSIEIRDEHDSLFLATGRVKVSYDSRDLFDKRVVVRLLEIEHPNVHLRYGADGKWNYQRIFPAGQPAPLGRRPGFGEFVVLDTAFIRDAKLAVTIPWRAPTTGTRWVRDSIVAAALSDTLREVRRDGNGFTRTWRWQDGNVALGYSRLADPDSAGRAVTVRDVSVTELDPPFRFRNVRGDVRQLGDSVWFRFPHLDLPGSTGSAQGKIICCGGLPLRYAAEVTGDSVSLADIAWVYRTLPRTGSGKMKLSIRNAPENLRVLNYAIRDMDVRSEGSRVLGAMTFAVGDPLLAVRDVRLRAAPVDFDLLRTLAGGPFKYDWQGKITGTIAASGGPLDRFFVERADLVLSDANVPGAVSRGTGRGMLDIRLPAFAVFRGFDVNVARFDLRTPRYLNPEFPKLGGFVSGTARLDSVWTDLRFSGAVALHRDGPGPASRVTGSGRVTLGDTFVLYNVRLNAAPLSLTTLARSYPAIPIRGEMSGPIRVVGVAPSLRVTATLADQRGTLAFDGTIDADEPRYAIRGSGSVSRADVGKLLRLRTLPASDVNAKYEVDLAGSRVANLNGFVSAASDDSRVDRVKLLPSIGRFRVTDGLARVDTLVINATGVTLFAGGAVSVARPGEGSLQFRAAFQSLESLKAYLGEESALGTFDLRGSVESDRWKRSLNLTVDGRNVALGEKRAESLTGSIRFRRDSTGATGDAVASVDGVRLRGLPVTRIGTTATLAADGVAHVAATLTGDREAATSIAARVRRASPDTVMILLDTASVRTSGGDTYRLMSPSVVTLGPKTATLDSLRLDLADNRRGGSLLVRGLRVANDSVRGAVQTRGGDLSVLEAFAPIGGARGPLDVNLVVSGSTRQPVIDGTIGLKEGRFTIPTAGVTYEKVHADIVVSNDTVHVRVLTAETAHGGRPGTLSVRGTVDLSTYTNPVFNLGAVAEHFRAIANPGVATLDVSTGPPIQLIGPFRGATLRGGLTVNEGSVLLPQLLGKDVIDLNDPELLRLVDTTVARDRKFLPRVPSAFVTNLTLDNVLVTLGEDVWLRSSEANIKLGGQLALIRGRTDSRNAGSSATAPQLALAGTLNAVRGTYVLNLGVVQPTFVVERGTLRFFGTPEVNPSLDIRAIHTVRRPRQSFNRDDVRILVSITGTLSAPELVLASADSLPLSQSDLLSYLVTGEPAFALSNTGTQYTEQLLTIGGRLAGTLLSSRIPRSVFDIVEVQTGTIGLEDRAQNTTSAYLSSLFTTRVILGKQLSERWFLGLSTGLCRANFAENLGLRLEYRISQTYSAQGGIEPGSGELACAGSTASRSFQQTPPQLGVDVFRTWRF